MTTVKSVKLCIVLEHPEPRFDGHNINFSIQFHETMPKDNTW